jgi:hypothetical protein
MPPVADWPGTSWLASDGGIIYSGHLVSLCGSLEFANLLNRPCQPGFAASVVPTAEFSGALMPQRLVGLLKGSSECR